MAFGNYAPFYRSGYFNPMQTIPTTNSVPNNADVYNTPYQYQNAQQPISNEFTWVQGEAGAKAYIVAPNNTVILWDSESPTIYIKSADNSGIPSMRTLDFTERPINTPKTPYNGVEIKSDNFVTKDDFCALQAKFDDLSSIVEEMKSKPTKKTAKGDE